MRCLSTARKVEADAFSIASCVGSSTGIEVMVGSDWLEEW